MASPRSLPQEDQEAPEPSKTLTAKLAEVMAAVGRIPKRGHNDFHGYDYATEADIADAIRRELAARRVILWPAIESWVREELPRDDGKTRQYLTTVNMAFTFRDGDTGESYRYPWAGTGVDPADKGLYKAITGAEKYFLLKTFLVPTGDDPERTSEADDAPLAVPAPPVGDEIPNLPKGVAYIRDITSKSGTKRDGGTWTKYRVVFSTGEAAATFSQTLAKDCGDWRQNQTPVSYEIEPADNPKWDGKLARCEPWQDNAGELTADDIPF